MFAARNLASIRDTWPRDIPKELWGKHWVQEKAKACDGMLSDYAHTRCRMVEKMQSFTHFVRNKNDPTTHDDGKLIRPHVSSSEVGPTV